MNEDLPFYFSLRKTFNNLISALWNYMSHLAKYRYNFNIMDLFISFELIILFINLIACLLFIIFVKFINSII